MFLLVQIVYGIVCFIVYYCCLYCSFWLYIGRSFVVTHIMYFAVFDLGVVFVCLVACWSDCTRCFFLMLICWQWLCCCSSWLVCYCYHCPSRRWTSCRGCPLFSCYCFLMFPWNGLFSQWLFLTHKGSLNSNVTVLIMFLLNVLWSLFLVAFSVAPTYLLHGFSRAARDQGMRISRSQCGWVFAKLLRHSKAIPKNY